MSLTAPTPDWSKEHIGGPLHLQVAAPPDGLQRGYTYRSMVVQPVRFVRGAHPSTAAGLVWNTSRVVETEYNLRTVALRDERGHLRMWTGYVAEGYWS